MIDCIFPNISPLPLGERITPAPLLFRDCVEIGEMVENVMNPINLTLQVAKM